MFCQTLEITLRLAYNQAKSKRHESITVDHLLLSLLDNPEAAKLLKGCGANIAAIRLRLDSYINKNVKKSKKLKFLLSHRYVFRGLCKDQYFKFNLLGVSKFLERMFWQQFLTKKIVMR